MLHMTELKRFFSSQWGARDGRRYIVIVGCGTFGSFLANGLSRHGHSVVVLDSDPRAFDKLLAEFSGFTLVGDASDTALLERAHIADADLVIAATREDMLNYMIALVALHVHGKTAVLARIAHPQRAAIIRAEGIQTVDPVAFAAEAIFPSLLSPASDE
jgi:trk system potassium uptake protein TrkA